MVYLALNNDEFRLLLNSLNDFRTRLISEGRYTDAIDDILLKLIKAPIKNIKVVN